MKKKLFIFGSKGAALDTAMIAMDCGYEVEAFVEENADGFRLNNIPVISAADFPNHSPAVIGVGLSHFRKIIVGQRIADWQTLIHPTAIVSPYVQVGKGGVIAAHCVLTCNISIGVHCQLNVATTICHDCQIGDYFTTAPGVHINGNNAIGHCVYIGSNAATKQGITIVDHCTVGMGANVVKSLTEPGVYMGTSAKLKK